MTSEWIFRKSPEAFKVLYEEIFEEVREAYLGEHQFWKNIYRDEFCCNVLFRYMLRLNHPSTTTDNNIGFWSAVKNIENI